MSVIGIDLGTTYSSVAVWRNGNVKIIENDAGNELTPSYIAFTNTERLIGDSAKDQAGLNPQNTVYNFKHLMGSKFNDETSKHDRFYHTYQNNKPKIKIEYKGIQKVLAPEETTAMILSKMKDIAETYLDTKVVGAVVTVPALFKNSQRQSTIDAGKIAGLHIKIINEPTAAAIAYGLEKKAEGNILIYNLGGGNCDVSIINITKGKSFEVIATSGDVHLGGEDFDDRLVGLFVNEIKQKYNLDILQSQRAIVRLRKEAEKIKRMLSSGPKALASVDSLHEDINFQTIITREQFENLCEDLFHCAMQPVFRVLRDANMKTSDICDVVLVGGSSRIPRVQEMLRDLFKGKLLTLNMNADEAAVRGAAAVAASLCEKMEQQIIVREVNPFPLYINCGTDGEIQIFEHNLPIPCSHFYNINYSSKMTVFERLSPERSNFVCEYNIEIPRENPLIKRKMQINFLIDNNGIFGADFKDEESYVVRISSCNLLEREKLQMIEEAQRFKEDDIENTKALNARNELEKIVFQIKRELASQTFLDYEILKQQVQSRCDEIIDEIDMDSIKSKKEYEVMKEELQNRYDSLKSKKLKDEADAKALHMAQIARTDLEEYVCDLKNTPELMLSDKMHSKLIVTCNEALNWMNSGSFRSHRDYETKKYELSQLSEYLKQEATFEAFAARKALEIYACNSKLNVDTSWGHSLVSQFNAHCDDVLSRIEIEDLRPEREYEFMKLQLVSNLQSIKYQAERANLVRTELRKYTWELLNNSNTMLSRNSKDKLETACNDIFQWLNTYDLQSPEVYARRKHELSDLRIDLLRTDRNKSNRDSSLRIGGNGNKGMAPNKTKDSKMEGFHKNLQSKVFQLQNEVKKSILGESEKQEILYKLDQILKIPKYQTFELFQDKMGEVDLLDKHFNEIKYKSTRSKSYCAII